MTSTEEYRRRWPELRAQVKQLWGRLSDDDLDRIDGQRDTLIEALEERYGRTRQEIEPEVRDLEQNFFGPLVGERRGDRAVELQAVRGDDVRDADATGVPEGDDVAARSRPHPSAPPGLRDAAPGDDATGRA